MADMMDKTIKSILTAFIAVILLASAFIPVAIAQINALPDMIGVSAESISQYTSLLSVVVVVTIVGIIVGVIKSYTSDDDDYYEGGRD